MSASTKNNKLLAANVRSLVLTDIQKALEDSSPENAQFKRDLLLKLAGSILPRLNEHTGEDGEAISINITNYGQLGNTLPIPATTVPAGDSTGTPKI